MKRKLTAHQSDAKYRHQMSCERKVKHPTLEEARDQARMYDGVEAYRCLWCHFWHIGHPPVDRRVKDRGGSI